MSQYPRVVFASPELRVVLVSADVIELEIKRTDAMGHASWRFDRRILRPGAAPDGSRCLDDEETDRMEWGFFVALDKRLRMAEGASS